ncbi:MAG TPA: hypothetical protein VFN13_12270 [Rudaea sp.]|nr:hypothetical protein [Rudaea sp.]
MHRVAYLLISVLLVAACANSSAANGVQGTYVVNGKSAQLTHATAQTGREFAGDPTTFLVFSEKPAGNDKSPDFSAQDGKYGNAVVVQLHKKGDNWDVIGASFSHTAMKRRGLGGTGLVNASDMKIADGQLAGHLTMAPGGADMFGESIQLDLHFHVVLP